jgi:hypothetical protein
VTSQQSAAPGNISPEAHGFFIPKRAKPPPSSTAGAERTPDWAKRGDVFVYFISKLRAPAAAEALIERVG